MAESANLTASLLVRRAVASETKPAATTADASAAPSPFFAKGDATAKQFRPVPSLLDALPTAAVAANEVAPSPAPAPRLPRRPRLSLRVERALHRRTKLACAYLGQTLQDFLLEAVDAFLEMQTTQRGAPQVTHLLPPRRHQPAGAPRAKLAVKVDAERRERFRQSVDALGVTQQAALALALDQHLLRVASDPARPSLRSLIDRHDVPRRGGVVIPFPAPAPRPVAACDAALPSTGTCGP